MGTSGSKGSYNLDTSAGGTIASRVESSGSQPVEHIRSLNGEPHSSGAGEGSSKSPPRQQVQEIKKEYSKNLLPAEEQKVQKLTKENSENILPVEESAMAPSDSDKIEAVLCNENELRNGEMKEFEVEGGKVVLVKDNNKFFAIGHKCTHYGAPLAKGAYSNGLVRCPWHGACFNVENGDIEDFPGLDSIPSYQTKIENGSVKVIASRKALADAKRTKPMCKFNPNSHDGPVVIVGGGGSALSCAETLRQDNFNGKIIMVTQETDLPYDRPKLSKALDIDVDTLLLRKQDFYREHGIEVLTGKEVTGVNVEGKSVVLSDGSNVHYKQLVLATGGKPRTLTCPGSVLQNVFYLRKPDDGKRIASAAQGKHVVVIGSSFIGMELACWAAKKVGSMTVVGSSGVPFQQVFGETIGTAILKLFESNGVHFQMGSGVEELRGEHGVVKQVVLKNGHVLPADVVIAGIGVVPSTDFLKHSGIEMNERGFIKVNEHMKTNLPDVYACGDIVVFPLDTFDNQVVNVQHWQMALKHGKIAGHNIAGVHKSVHTVPFFWTVLFGKSLRYTGYSAGFDDVIIHGDTDGLKFVAYFMKQNQLVAVGAMNRDPVASQIAELFRNKKKITKDMVIENADDIWHQHLAR